MFVLMFIVVVFCRVSASSQDAYPEFCSQIHSMHQHCTRMNGSSTKVMRGRPGKQGPRGFPGISPAVDYDRVDSTISQHFIELTTKMNSQNFECCRNNGQKINHLQNELLEMKKKLDKLLTWQKASNGFYYKLFHTKVDYATAKSRCLEKDAILASAGFRDRNVRSLIVDLIKAGNDDTWIGADDIANEGTWVWADGAVAKAGEINWFENQPDNSGKIENCAHYRPSYNWQVNDDPCHRVKKYVCESKV